MSDNGLNYYIKELLKISAPIVLGNIGFILIGLGDVIIAGRHSTDTFAAISIATAILNCIFIFGIGLISAISPLLSNYRGERRVVKRYFYPSLRFSLLMAVITFFVILLMLPFISKMGFEPKLVPYIKEYIFISSFSVFGAYLHACLKEFLQTFEIVMFPNLLTLFCVVLNVILNIIFVFGIGPIPSMGIVGLAIASLIVRYFMGIVLLGYCFYTMRLNNYHDRDYYGSLIKLGMPISLAVFVEFVAFNSIAILMGRVSGVYAAAQNLVCSLTTVSFMVPFAISNAIAIKVGFANGAGDIHELKRYADIGTAMSVGFMFCSALIFLSFPKFIVAIFTVDDNIYHIVCPVMLILGLFQVFDGLQVALSGICKGVKQTDIVLLANFLSYWCVAIPVGCILGLYYKWYLVGFWIGLCLSSILLCSIMLFKLKYYFKKKYGTI